MTEDRPEPKQAIDRYFEELEVVPGWLARVDFQVLEVVSRTQVRRAVGGDLLEIGAYHGKTAILLKFLCADDEELVVCDLFESPNVPVDDRAEVARWYGTGVQRTRFEETYLRYHSSLPRILEMPSTDLPGADLGARFRLIHIDGSHVFETVRSDIRATRDLSSVGAIVAIDDYGRSHCPGIPPAVWQAHLDLGLQPFLLTEGKLYAHWGDFDDDLLKELEQDIIVTGLVVERHSVLGGEVLSVREAVPSATAFRKFRYLLTPPAVPLLVSRLRRMQSRLRAGVQRRPYYRG